MNRLSLSATPLPGLKMVERLRLGDTRGSFARIFCADELASAGWEGPVAQVNQSFTATEGTLRGMHFQHPPYAETKLVSCVRGTVWDVAIDLRVGSPTFLRWHAETLSALNNRAFLIPQGFAHGFQTLTEDVELIYIHSAAHAPHAEGGLNPLDPALAIPWPKPVAEISARDQSLPFITAEFKGVAL